MFISSHWCFFFYMVIIKLKMKKQNRNLWIKEWNTRRYSRKNKKKYTDIRNHDHVPSQSDETNNRMGTH
uniref:Uncharacterized protein n=1 Tax=Populus tomentosa TaxID=118781 RepID=A0A1L6K574_POPTO|nr:hypothetical protein [Populus tomentosa]